MASFLWMKRCMDLSPVTVLIHKLSLWPARQLPILYNREKKAKSVGCKIGDLRSKVAFNIRGLLNVETCAVDYGCL